MDDIDKLNEVQEILTEAHLAFSIKRGRNTRDREFAKYLHTNYTSLNQWANGIRTPNSDNANIIAVYINKLVPDLGDRLLKVLGYKKTIPFETLTDEEIFILENWRDVDQDARHQIIEHIREEIERKRGDGRERPLFDKAG